MAETSFKISIPNERLDQLKQKLALTVFPDELEDAGWDYGVPLAETRRLITYWKDGYDWRKHEALLNKELPQFTRDIEVEGHGTLNIHYIHKKSDVVDAIPLLFVHGWPGSFVEVRKILPLLIQGSVNYPVFHVVALSLPGFGFSEAPKKKGFSINQYAEVAHKLMLALGYNQYVTQGGDWGYTITAKIAELYGPKHAKAWHSNMPIAAPPSLFTKPFLFFFDWIVGYTEEEKEGLERPHRFLAESGAYFKQQSTHPQTVGYSLADSPSGLLAWIYEKLIDCSDAYPFKDDEVLTWVSIYWFSRAGPTASLRIYSEAHREKVDLFKIFLPTNVYVGISHFPREIFNFPRRWFKAPNLVFQGEHESGGHFAAYEKPQEFVDDLRKMFGKGSRAFGVVPGKTGFS